MERLDKRLAATGVWSRKEARDLVRAGRVTVDGAVCRKPEDKVSESAVVLVDGQPIGESGPVYIMLHKPAGLVSATEDAREKTVLSLLPERYQRLGLFPRARLRREAREKTRKARNQPRKIPSARLRMAYAQYFQIYKREESYGRSPRSRIDG